MSKTNRYVLYLVLVIITMTILFSLFIIDNLMVVLDEASVITLRPIKTGVPKELAIQDITYGKNTREQLDIYRQPNDGKLHPTFIFIPGGLWQGHNKRHYAHVGGIAQRSGYTAVVLNLPYYPGFVKRKFLNEDELREYEFIGQLAGFQRAALWIKNNIHKYGGDPNKIVLCAFDSGAQVSLSSVLQGDEVADYLGSSIKKILLISPIVDIASIIEKKFFDDHIHPIFNQDINCFNSPLCRVDEIIHLNAPILLLIPQGEMQFLMMQQAMFANENPTVILKKIDKTSRRSIIFRLGRRSDAVTKEVMDFIKLPL